MPQSKPKVRHKTFTYRTAVKWQSKRAGLLASEGKPEFRVASPPEFKGEEGVWSPEDLFVAAVDICTMTTFLAFAQHKRLPLVSYETQAEGLLEFADGGYRFTKITLHPTIVVETEDAIAAAQKILDDAHQRCLISNSIHARVVVDADISANGRE